jgi:hypothetical protein
MSLKLFWNQSLVNKNQLKHLSLACLKVHIYYTNKVLGFKRFKLLDTDKGLKVDEK